MQIGKVGNQHGIFSLEDAVINCGVKVACLSCNGWVSVHAACQSAEISKVGTGDGGRTDSGSNSQSPKQN